MPTPNEALPDWLVPVNSQTEALPDWLVPVGGGDTETEKPRRTKKDIGLIEAAKNTGVQLAEGVNTILGAVPSLIAPGSDASEFFKSGADYWNQRQSDELLARQAEANQVIQRAGQDGIMSQIGAAASEYASDPALAARFAATNVASIIPGLGLGKAAQVGGAAAGLSAKGIAALGTGVAGGTNSVLNAGGARGDAYDDIKQALVSKGIDTATAHELALEGSVMPAAVGAATGYLGGKIGLEKALLGQATAGAAAKKAGGAFAGEMAGEQIEEVLPKLATNTAVQAVDPTRKTGEDIGRTMVETAFGAGPTSTAAASATGYRTFKEGVTAPEPATPITQPAQPVTTGQGAGATQPTPVAPTPQESSAEKALRTPVTLTALDRVNEIDTELAPVRQRLQELTPENGYGPAFDQERLDLANQATALDQERSGIAATWPNAAKGAATTFSTEAGAKLGADYALMEADDLVTSHDESLKPNPLYPAELQPRERDRAASSMQVSGIVQKLDPARLGLSADAATGAPIVGADGLVESGNARTIALKRVFQANGQKAADYKDFLRSNYSMFGIDPSKIETMAKPVLVRVRSTPVNRAEFARQANASTVAAMSPSEQAKSDANRIDSMEDLTPDDNGDFSNAASRPFVSRFLARLPMTEQAGMVDSTGNLSTSGYARVRNAVLAKAYGDSPVLARMTESMNDELKNVSRAFMLAAPKVAAMRSAIKAGNRFDADITPDLMAASEELARIKTDGGSVADALAQTDIMGDQRTPEARQLLQFMSDNMRRPRKMADFIAAYMDALEGFGDPKQGSMFDDAPAPKKQDLLQAAGKVIGNDEQINGSTSQGTGAQAAGQTGQKPGDAPGNSRRDQGNGAAGSAAGGQGQARVNADGQNPAQGADAAATQAPGKAPKAVAGNAAAAPGVSAAGAINAAVEGAGVSEWVNFPKETGTIGIPRADMPQIKGEHRGALIQFLQGRGITHETKDVPASSLKPTQAEFSTAKAQKWSKVREGSDRSVLVSNDGHILDGHHQWIAAVAANEPIQAIVLDAPIRDLMANVFQFPSVKQSDGATSDAAKGKLAAREDFKAAMGELADYIHGKLGGRAMMMPPSDVKLQAILVKLFDAAFAVAGRNIEMATVMVKEALKGNFRTKTYWNKITNEAYKKAADASLASAAKAHVDDLFSAAEKRGQVDMFGDAPMPAAAPVAPKVAMINGKPYDYTHKTGDNYNPPGVSEFLSVDEVKRADDLVDKYYTNKPEVSLAADLRAQGEKLIKPFIDKAVAAKTEYDQKIINIAKRTKAIGQLLAPIKSAKRAVEKMHDDAVEKGREMRADDVKDLLRSTIVVSRYEDAQAVLDEIGKEFDILRTKNRTETSFTQAKAEGRKGTGGYSDVLVNVQLPNGTVAEIQINIPEMLAAKEGPDKQGQGHKLFEAAREQKTTNPALYSEIYKAMEGFYDATFLAAQSRALAAAAKKPLGSSVDPSARDGNSLTPGSASNDIPSSANLNHDPSGKRTKSSPSESPENVDPTGNLSGTFISSPSGSIVDETAKKVDNSIDKQGANDANNNTRKDSPAGEKPGAVQGTGKQGRAQRVRDGSVGPDLFGGGDTDAGTATPGEVGQAGADGMRGQNEDGRRAEPGDRAGRNAGVPAGRDIPAKSGLNYAFGDDDLTYEGSWQKKATQNIEAVELLKKLQSENRQATPEEQKVLAKFIGWGSGELANTLFSPKGGVLDKAEEAIKNYNEALAAWGDRTSVTNQRYAEFAPAFNLLRAKDKNLTWYNAGTITREMLDKARPEPAVMRWLAMRDRLRAILTKEELAEASRSTQYAHYTSKPIVKSMWRAIERMGFKGGTMLEPGGGIGVFPGLMPAAMAANSSYTGIEFDSITGGILKQLFPDERILIESFVDSKLPKNFYDVAAGNPPFSGTQILSDPEYKKFAFSLHDYFFAKSIDRVKPGGLVMYITSRYTMDKLDDKARAYLAERADLVGAIRLPQTAFKQNAGTEVVTDVIFLRKKVKGQTFDKGQAWGKSVPIKVGGQSFPINEYFHAHPEMVLGQHSDTGKMQNSPEPQYTVTPLAGDIEAHFAKAVENLPADIYQADRGSDAEAAKVREIDFNPKAQKEGNFYVTDAGVLMVREGGVGVRAVLRAAKDAELVKDFVPLRDALKQAHYDQLNNGDWETSLAALQKAYKAFTAKNGFVNQFTVKTTSVKTVDEETGETYQDEQETRRFTLLEKLKDDPDYTLVAAIENVNDDTGSITPSSFLTERVLEKQATRNVSTPIDALLTTLNDIGHVDIDLIAGHIGLTRDQTIEALGTAIYQDPESDWTTADEYLSGNVKAKLKSARAAAETDKRYERNIDALLAVQPAPLSPGQINPNIGMNWIPGETYAQFVNDITEGAVKAEIRWEPATKAWLVQAISGENTQAATADWGTGSRNVVELLEHALKSSPIRVTRTEGSGENRKTVFDDAATEAATQKLAELRAKFGQWVFSEPNRTDKLVRIYNDIFNTTVPRSFNGAHLTLPGTSKQTSVFDHVKRGAWRIIQRGNTYLAHAVGSGKTYQMVISAMEQKRLGLIKKPMIVVPNHMLKQFASEWQQLYPAARLMVADENNFHTDNRRRFVSRVALSDLDGVIITHSAFKILDLDPKFKAKMIEEELTFLRASLEEAGGDPDEKGKSRDPKIKRIEKQIENREQQLEATMSSEGKDKNVRFDELGVDFLYVDEAHEFRKLDFATTRQVKGISPTGSGRAFDLYMKSRYLEEKTPGRSMVLASGTPVTNTMAEMYTVQKLMDRQAMIDKNVDDFDSWASMFGREVTELEAGASGKYEPVTRFQKFANVPELTQMFREFADVLTPDDLGALLGDKRPKVKDGARKLVLTPKTSAYKDFQEQDLIPRVEASKAWKPSKDEPNNPDPIIKILGDARLAAMDMRFMEPTLPNDPDSKLNRMIDDVIARFKESADMEFKDKKTDKAEPNKGASMMVFADLGFGASAALNRGFNARAWFEKRMRDAGIPMDQVAFMSDYKKSVAKQKLFRDVNAGRVRMLVGSSKNMGTGVNAQQRLKYLFHADAPWYPADLEQREGRIIRTGNKNPLVEIYAYATKGTYEQDMWAGLARKQLFIDQALSGDPNVREIEDVGSAGQMAQISAAIADDPRVLQLAGLNADINKYQRLYRAHEEQRQKHRRQYEEAQYTISFFGTKLPLAEKDAAKVKDLSGANFRAKVLGKEFDDRTKWGEALIAQFKTKTEKSDVQPMSVGEISGFKVAYFGHDPAQHQHFARLTLETPNAVDLVLDAGTSAMGVAMRAQNAIVDVARQPDRMRERIAQAKSEMDSLVPRLEAPFPFSQALADAIAERDALEAELTAPPAPAPTNTFGWDEYLQNVDPMESFLTGNKRDAGAVVLEPGFRTRLSRGNQTGSAAFKKWFAGSNVVDSDGRPKVMYHGTTADITAFKDGSAIYVADTGQAASEYAKQFGFAIDETRGIDGNVMPLYVKAENTFDYKSKNHIDWLVKELAAAGSLASVPIQEDEDYYPIYNDAKEALSSGDPYAYRSKVVQGVISKRFDSFYSEARGVRNLAVFSPDQVKSAIGNSGNFDPKNPDIRMARGAGAGGMDLKALSALANRIKAKMPGMPEVVVLSSPADTAIPASLRAYIEEQGAMLDAEGAMHDGKLYLFASGLSDPLRAEHVLAEHEAAHFGLRAILGDSLKTTMQMVFNNNAVVRRAAADLQNRGKLTDAEATEEVIVDIPSSQLIKLQGWRKLTVRVRDWLADHGFEAMAAKLSTWLDGHLNDQQRADLFVAGLVRSARGSMRSKPRRKVAGTMLSGTLAEDWEKQEKWLKREAQARGYKDIDTLAEKNYPLFEKLAELWRQKNPADNGVLLSRGAPPVPVAQRAEQIIQTNAATAKPVDALVRKLTQLTGIERLTRAIYGKAGYYLDRFTPETVKAGMVSDYGVPDAVIDQRAMMQGRQRVQLRKAGSLIEKLSTLTRAESRVAYEWMNETDPHTIYTMMQNLPEESVKVLMEVQAMIDNLSKEAVRMGQLSPEAYERNKFAYLRRSYAKYTLGLTESEKKGRARAISVLGEQYKGRGLTESAAMDQIKNAAPEWWKRKLAKGKADVSLKGEKLVRLERHAPSGQGTVPLAGMTGKQQGKLLEVHYFPAGVPMPAKYADWTVGATFEVRDTKGDKVILWRDFTKDERENMGEIDEARFAIAKTLHAMVHDVEVGRYLEWLAHTQAKKEGEQIPGVVVNASERYLDTFKPGEWVRVPETKIPGTTVMKYGKLSGRYLPGPVWNDLRQTVNGQFKPFGETYAKVLSFWKTAKTALSPGVHTNNIMSNLVMADWHDVTAGHTAKAMRIIMGAHARDGKGLLGGAGNLAAKGLGIVDRESATEIMTRYLDSGGNIGSWATNEIATKQIEPLLEAMEAELAATNGNSAQAQIGVMAALQHLRHGDMTAAWEAAKGSKPGKIVGTEAQNLIDMYQSEDEVFRLAAWLKAKEEGKTDMEAGKIARRSFMDYNINAPWVQAMRNSALPFISYSYRAIPMLLEFAGTKPHKLMKLMLLAGAVNTLGVMLAGGGDDDEDKLRKLLPEEKAGRIWGMVPKLIRMPWNDANSSPVYLDVRRFIPVGDVLDLGAGHSAIPLLPMMQIGGPLAIAAEFYANKSNFTGKPITLDTDTPMEKAAKVADHLYKAFMPNILGLPNTYATTGVMNAADGVTDKFGREQSVAQAMASSFGVKLGSYPTDVLRKNLQSKAMAETMEIDRNIGDLKRQRQTNALTAAEFEKKVRTQQEKKQKIMRELGEKFN